MYGPSSKLGRGAPAAGRGAGPKRLHSMLPPQRPSRLSMGPAPHARGGTASAAPGAPAAEETFSLVNRKSPAAFAMIIRLAPGLVDEITRLETTGGTARIKFDSVANNPVGNVIDVGGKEFKFTSSQETGDLCDIYEQRQSGQDGKGLLVETGSAWRKLNVQRILDESSKNRVKRLSEEAERKKDLRRSIVLDPGNPSMKSQIKQLAAVETNPWKHFKHKKEPPPKKRKIEPPPVGGPPKAVFKSGISLTNTVKTKHSSSPVPSPPEQSGPVASPLRTVNTLKNHASVEEIVPNEAIGKDKATALGFDKEISSKATSVAREVIGRKNNVGAKPVDLHSALINLLRENPKGMSLKALEKAVGDSIPNAIRQIEPILKRIATFQAPGRYLLKPEGESEGVKKPASEIGSSPEEILHQTPAAEENREQIHVVESDFNESVALPEFVEKEVLNTNLGDEPNVMEKIDNQQHSPGERKVSDHSEGHVGSSSDSGSDSDSDSDSSDSGSDSGSPSRSRSKSPVGSGSGSSSDSDSDVSSNSKEGSDEDVDIMSDDDKEQKPKLQPDQAFSRSPSHWRSPDVRLVQGGNEEKQDGHECDVEIEKDEPYGKPETTIAGSSVPSEEQHKSVEKTNSSSPDRDQERQNFIGSLFDERESTGRVGFELSDSFEKISKGKNKRALEVKHAVGKSDKTKRSKQETLNQHPISRGRDAHFQESSRRFSSDKLTDDPFDSSIVNNGPDREGNGEFSLPKGNSQALPGKSHADFQQSGRRPIEQSAKASDLSERPDNHDGSLGHGRKNSEKNSHVPEGFPSEKGKSRKDAVHGDAYYKESKALRNNKEGSVKVKQSTPSDSHLRKNVEVVGKSKDGGLVSGSFPGTSLKENIKTGLDRSPVVNGRGIRLQREYSDLELGELREPLPGETPAKKQFDRKGSFKQSENKPGPSDNCISDTLKGKVSGKATLELGKSSGLDLNAKDPGNLEGSGKKRNNEDRNEDLPRSQLRVSQHQSRAADTSEPSGLHANKLTDTNGNYRQSETSVRPGTTLEGYGESNKKAQALQQHDGKREIVSHSTRERKRGTSNTVAELPDGRADLLLAEGNNSERKRRDSSSDENSCSYSKYEKDVPDLKGPIKDSLQYKEYVHEYRNKYDSYCSLNKILDSYRNEFQKLGKDLELAKGRDTESYFNILEQLKESYRHCGTRHKRLKKIFVVLHEELKQLKQRIKDFALSYSKD